MNQSRAIVTMSPTRRLSRAVLAAAVSLTAVGSPALAQEPPSEAAPERVTINGRVVDQLSRAPLPGVLVEVVELGVGVETDSLGNFEVRGIQVGVYNIAMTRVGYRRSAGELAILRPGSFVTELVPIDAPLGPAPGRFVGRVTDADSGDPISGAEVRVHPVFMGGLTSEDGSFRFDAVPPGRHAVVFSYLGYETREDTIEVVSGLTSDVVVPMAVDPIEMDPIEVTVEPRELFLEDIGFYERRDRGFGEFVDLFVIESRGPQRMTDVFTGLPGVQVVPNQFEPLERSVVLRGGRMGMGARTGGNEHCYPLVAIDGLVVHRGGFEPAGIDRLVDPQALLGVEVYPSSVGVPIQLAGVDAACGVIMLWTRR